MSEDAGAQLATLGEVGGLLDEAGYEWWLFGGWAVDFYVGSVGRPHDDVDLAVWLEDLPRIAVLLEREGWRHTPHEDEDGGTGFERDGVRVELMFLRRDGDGVFTPLADARIAWPDDSFADDVRQLAGVRARVISLDVLLAGKEYRRDDPAEAAKDSADLARLRAAGHG